MELNGMICLCRCWRLEVHRTLSWACRWTLTNRAHLHCMILYIISYMQSGDSAQQQPGCSSPNPPLDFQLNPELTVCAHLPATPAHFIKVLKGLVQSPYSRSMTKSGLENRSWEFGYHYPAHATPRNLQSLILSVFIFSPKARTHVSEPQPHESI